MKFTYYVKGFIAFSEPDHYDTGCDPSRCRSHFDDSFTCEAATLEGLIGELADVFKADRELFTLDGCEEAGRLDLQVLQTTPFVSKRLSLNSEAQWRRNERVLWLTNYIFDVKFRIEGMPLTTYPAYLNNLPDV